jgi:cytochrome P450
MFIPKGSTIITNLWGINLNPDDFPDPHRFDPERCVDWYSRQPPLFY